jgi:hypothetical protein
MTTTTTWSYSWSRDVLLEHPLGMEKKTSTDRERLRLFFVFFWVGGARDDSTRLHFDGEQPKETPTDRWMTVLLCCCIIPYRALLFRSSIQPIRSVIPAESPPKRVSTGVVPWLFTSSRLL